MKISFSLKEDRKRPYGYLEMTPPPALYYEAYFADVEISFGGSTEKLSNVPMLYFVTVLQDLLSEAYLAERKAEGDLWDTGHRLSLGIEGDGATIALEIPSGTIPLRFPLREFIAALRAATLKLLWTMYDDEPRLLSREGIFKKGSIQDQAALLILQGKLPRYR
jgi:hypothetical protein